MRIEYREVHFDDLLKRAAEEFAAKLPAGESMYSHHAFLDVQKGVAVLKLYVNDVPGQHPQLREPEPCPGAFWIVASGPSWLPAEGRCSECGKTAEHHQ